MDNTQQDASAIHARTYLSVSLALGFSNLRQTLTLKHARRSEGGKWIRTDDYLLQISPSPLHEPLNRAVYGAAFRRHRKQLGVLPVLEKASSAAPHCKMPLGNAVGAGLDLTIRTVELVRKIHHPDVFGHADADCFPFRRQHVLAMP